MQIIKKSNILAGSLSQLSFKNINLIFDKLTCDFLDSVSKKILNDKEAKKYSDLIAFAFWIRKKNLSNLKQGYNNNELRLGRGLVFHITPSNVAMNFAYSFVVGLLSGNCNIIRLPNRQFIQSSLFLKIIKQVFNEKKYIKLKKNNIFIKYDHNNNNITQKLCLTSDCRVIWGSDETIIKLKKFDTKPSCTDIIFSDRYSMSIINVNYLNKLSDKKFKLFILNFFNDAFLFNQNSCTSPHLIIWYGQKRLKKNFWEKLNLLLLNKKSFVLSEKESYDRYLKFCELSSKKKDIKFAEFNSNFYKMTLSKLPFDITKLRHGNGYFFEFFTNNIKLLSDKINQKVQTITYFGFSKNFLRNFIKNHKPKGINRFVPVGRSSEFNPFWDGYDLIRSLSKKIEI